MDYNKNQEAEIFHDLLEYQRDYSDGWNKYDWVKIGCRIRDERKKLGLSQKELIYRMRNREAGIGKETLIKLENGVYGKDERFTASILSDLENAVPVKGLAIRQLTALCDIFDCDIGYILCEYEEKKVEKRDIVKYTGLSEQAVDNLHAVQANGDRLIHILPFINQLLSDPSTVVKLSSYLNTLSMIATRAKSEPSKFDEMHRDGAIFGISRTIAERTEKMFHD